MNTKRFLLAGAIGALTVFSSCKKDNDTKPSDTVSGSFSCKVDGVAWEAESITSARLVKAEVTTGVFSKSILISVAGKDGSTLSFTITDMKDGEVGECLNYGTYYAILDENLELNYHIGNIYSGAGVVINEENGNVISAETGSASFDECADQKVSGTFSFGATDFSDIESEVPVMITEGKFTDIKYTVF